MYSANFRDENNELTAIEGESLEEIRAELERREYTGPTIKVYKLNGSDDCALAGWASATTWRYA